MLNFKKVEYGGYVGYIIPMVKFEDKFRKHVGLSDEEDFLDFESDNGGFCIEVVKRNEKEYISKGVFRLNVDFKSVNKHFITNKELNSFCGFNLDVIAIWYLYRSENGSYNDDAGNYESLQLHKKEGYYFFRTGPDFATEINDNFGNQTLTPIPKDLC